jgi:transposase
MSGMRKPIFVRELRPKERQALEDGLRSSSAFTMRRCQILLASAAGQRAPEIGHNLHCNDQTVRNAIYDFGDRGLDALMPGSSRPHTIHSAFDEQRAKRLKALLHESPRAFGKPTSVWTLDLVAEVAFAEGLTASRVTGETIRATLKRLGVSWRRAKQWITSPDPQYGRKKTPATA